MGDKKHISSEELLKKIASFSQYANPSELRRDSIFYVTDPTYQKIPFKIFIPASYDASRPNALVLLLHGAVQLASFNDAFNRTKDSEVEGDPFIEALRSQGYIVVMPYGDNGKNFNWSSAEYGRHANPTFNSLANLIKQIKSVLNVDDNRVFSFGHSDGSDGTFMLDVYKSSVFAGFVAYNSMLTNLFTYNIYLKNTLNRPLYLVHSDLDDIRPIQQTELIVRALDSIKAPVTYKEYSGYKHMDAHLMKDFKNSVLFLGTTVRNPFPKSIYWETNDSTSASIDWMHIVSWDLQEAAAAWHRTVNVKTYNKVQKTYMAYPYYIGLDKSAAIKASYKDNSFAVETSRVTKFEILINPMMVDLNREVSITVNGKLVYRKKVVASNDFTVSQFLKNYDKKALWVASIVVDVDQ
ncbi:hypothetical protein KXD93_16780 [Mucilaginibacter sp. BJC16-A38]|uniref:hypothetical protein n=1 Tax=Mucilaginibacter phenanthrenivorans TaxID=1234842 RepID=UPI00215773E4|nr:hypothetical protein [Mucilaginibacter phenanthrenivorans]MCR8559315.1 hypothetical protein [Mucilaginibacter phenanthrenivorans]